jgi:hypothetical protein
VVVSIALGDDGTTDASQYTATTTLTFGLIDHLTGRVLMLHAGGVSDSAGRVVALVAASGGGKSTAVRVLAAEAFGYVTDETVAIQEDGSVEPYAKPLAFVTTRAGGRTKVQKGPDELGLNRCPEQLYLARVVVLAREDTATDASLEPLPLLDAMLELIPQTSALPALERPLQRLAEALDRTGGAFRLRYVEAPDTTALISDLVTSSLATSSTWTAVGEPPTTPPLIMKDGAWAASRWQDAIRVDDEVLLLVDGIPMRLGGIGVAIWDAVRMGATEAEFVSAVTRVHGAHPDAGRLVAEAVEALLAGGAIVHRVPLTIRQVLAGQSKDDVPSGASPSVEAAD